MTLIEGIGDEVTDFFIVVGVIVVGWIAWCSTNISEQPLIRTVLILQHRTRTRIAELRASDSAMINDSLNNRISSTDESTPSEETVEPINHSQNETDQNCLLQNQNVPQTSEPPTNPVVSMTNRRAGSEDALIEAMDSGNDETQLSLESKVEDSRGSITERGPIETCPLPAVSTDNSQVLLDQGEEIIIKLKFINDDQRVVTGRPKEMLGDFKRRHFQEELEAQKRVRLVFNGHVLQPDSETLEQCGLYNNCVVHCLVHQPRANSTNPNSIHSSSLDSSSSSMYSNPQSSFQNMPNGSGMSSVHNEWDLSRLLVTIVTLMLAFAWYSRYHYAQLFTATTTLALYALTAVFTLSLFGHFFPDQDTLRNID